MLLVGVDDVATQFAWQARLSDFAALTPPAGRRFLIRVLAANIALCAVSFQVEQEKAGRIFFVCLCFFPPAA